MVMLLYKDKWTDFVAELARRNLQVPVEDQGVIKFATLPESPAPALEHCNTTVPPKAHLFPQTETLYRFQPGNIKVETPSLEEESVLLGVRPCDARAISIVERLFGGEIDDPYFRRRRELVTLVGVACREPGINCFCTSVGGGPASTEGLDLLLVDLGESYYLQAVTGKGEALLEATRHLLQKAPEEAVNRKEQLVNQSAEKIRRSIDLRGIPEGLPTLWEDPLWRDTAAACLGCGICTYLCPTCHCFDIQDELEGRQGRRYRNWDSCMFSEYSLHASKHNPRPTRRERTRNRINHKYNYFVQKFGVIACVGCGRCINLCPVNIDLLEVLGLVKEALRK
ncbi:MAG TPA: (4Fe-4S)-binding protein [Firmicutes bacterium]|nr:(4Fe-4S)-binding protein [Bacillota bacterium]